MTAPLCASFLQTPGWREVLTPAALQSMSYTEQHSKPCLLNSSIHCPEAEEWDRHWKALDKSLRGRLFTLFRRQVRARSVSGYLARHFRSSGVYVECGSGSAQASWRIRQRVDQTFLALDFARGPLTMALGQQCMSGGIQADIRHLPFRDQSVAGIWNLGVMEHFEADEQLQILREFNRVLQPGGQLLLWWPPRLALDHFLLSQFGWRFPAEPGRVTRKEAIELLNQAGFRKIKADFPIDDALTELVLHGTATHGNQASD